MGTDLYKVKQSKYQSVIDYLRNAIESGVFQSGDKLPSIRLLSERLSVSKNTVIRAYQELEAIGVLEAVSKSGYRVLATIEEKIETVAPSEVDLLGVCKEILSYPDYKELLPTGSAHPCIDAPAIRSLYAEIGRQSRQQANILSHYQLPPGEPLLVKQLAKLTQELGTPAPISELLVTHGAQQAISLALRATTQPGDIIAVESPCYFGTLLLLESLGLQAVEIPSCPRDGIKINALKEAISRWDIRAIIVTPNFANPTGALMPLNARRDILTTPSTIPIIEDDVFGSLSYQPPLPSIRSLDTEQRVIYVNSLSKNLDSRLRIGWMLAGQYRQTIEKLLLCDNMGSLNLMQSAVGTFLSSGKYKAHLTRMTRLYQSNVKQFLNQFHQSASQYPKLNGRYRVVPVSGSFLLWIQLPEQTDCFALYRECKANKVSILPGSVFGTSGQYQYYFRISVANLSLYRNWKEGVELLVKLVEQHVEA
ncbi:PLP-dependent aminotransferase family protein [Vibrio sp. MarTm2]|uniref:aminotransferase-like domain-containing protein n=1 Tax=Vibrio sp. MarTm2 TaxID=2998831 RepID=UPI0022CD60D0|nr:PLP-dependent aminotransferase family protein [Vibrio sp. MarTm2]MDA0128703.1 PLP-dependent aminotransferase family protein [Vibrio sp. MarTm2]